MHRANMWRMYLRNVKVPSSSGKTHEYVRIVEAYRQDGKAKQRVVADLGRKDLLVAMLPQLQRLLLGADLATLAEGPAGMSFLEAATWGPMLVVQHVAEQLGLTAILRECLPTRRSAEKEGSNEPRGAACRTGVGVDRQSPDPSRQ